MLVLAIAACRSAAAPLASVDASAEPITVPIAPAPVDASLVTVFEASSPSVDASPPPLADACPTMKDAGARTLHDVDWKSCSYPGTWGGRLHDGHAESHLYGPDNAEHDTMETDFVAVAYGDIDGDGIEDVNDQCPDDPEDRDNFQDEDGCPDPDNDNDRVLDVNDRCPMDAEDLDGFEDQDGCPEADNDGDGATDLADFSCSSAQDNDETNPKAQCQDGLDNDSDGATDTNDFSCSNPQDNDETNPKSQCQNGIDDDSDGQIDLADPGCSERPPKRCGRGTHGQFPPYDGQRRPT